MKSRAKFYMIAFLIFIGLHAQSPEGFNYQAVVRNSSGEVLTNQSVGIRMTLIQGSANGSNVYRETFTKTTNGFGLINLVIGTGNVSTGSFSTIDWASGPYFLETAIDQNGGTNYSVLGTSQLMSVPFAMYAASAANDGADGEDGADGKSAYELWLEAGNSGTEDDFLASLVGEGGTPQDLSLSGTELSISEGSTIDLSAIDTDTQLTEAEVDAFVDNNGYLTSFTEVDGDATNELQTLSTAEDGALLSISGGNTIVLTDANSSNELNTSVTFEGTLLRITDPGGTLSADLAALQNDADADPENENQTVSAGAGISVAQTDQDFEVTNTAPDQTVWLADGGAGNVTIAGTYPDFTIDVASLDDADADPANELISSVILNGTTLETTDAGGTTNTDLSSLVDDSDADPANELVSSVVLNGTDLETTDAGGTITTDLSSLVNDADADPANEIQEISTDATPGNITITDGATLSLNVDDADADPTNEIQNLQVIADTVFLTGNPNPTKVLLGGRNSYGDIKHSFQLSDHDGWYKLDGRALTALPETAAQIASDFFTGNLPDATDRFLKGNDGIETNGDVGGSNAITIAQQNLENFSLPVSGEAAGAHDHGGNTGSDSHTHNIARASGVATSDLGITTSVGNLNSESGMISGDNHSHTIPAAGNHVHNTQVTSGGSSTPIPKPSYLATNIFVYLGGTTLADLQALGQSNQEVLNSGISPLTIWSDNNAILDDLLGLNYNGSTITLQTYVDQGIDLLFLYNQYKKSLLDNTTVTTLDAYNAGVSIGIMSTDGSSVSDFQNDGIAIAIVNGSGLFSLQELKDGNYTLADLLTVSSVEDLLNGTDLTVQEMSAAGVPAADFHGVAFEGGLIFYTETDGTTYIAEDNDQPTGIIWAMDGSVSTMNAIGVGQANTAAIVAFDPGVNAATTCNDLIDGDTFSDWYLPSRSELQEMYANLKVKGFGNFTDAFYWSSSAASTSRAEAIDFTDGQSASGSVDRERTNTHRVRAIRSFVSAPN